MSFDPNRSHESFASAAEREPASPPYLHSQYSGMPPTYQSRANLRNGSPDDKGKQRSPPSSSEGVEERNTTEPRAVMTSNGPRIAVTEPLADMRKKDGMQRDNTPKLKIDDSAVPDRPAFSRRGSDASSINEQGDDFDEFNWSEDEEQEEQKRREEAQAHEVSHKRKKISPFKIIKWLATTFLGNFIISAALAVPVIVMQFVYRPQASDTSPEAQHKDYVADNIQAWFIWAAFNLHVEWWIHLFVELIPRFVLTIIKLFWGGINQNTLTFTEYYNAIKNYVKPVFYAALSWGSWAIIFNSIYNLYTRDNPATESRAAYLYRVYQVIEFLFFLTVTICAEKILVRIISMRFHKTAYSDRIAKTTKALKVFDHLKDYRPKIAESKGSSIPFGLRIPGARTPGRTTPGVRTPTGIDEGTVTPADAYAGDDEGTGKNKRGFFGIGRKTHANKRPAYSPATDELPPRQPGSSSQDPTLPGTGTPTPRSRTNKATSAVKNKAEQASTLARVAMNDPTKLLDEKTVGVGIDVTSPAEARRLARSIFLAFRGKHRRNYLVTEDFNAAYKNPSEAKEAFAVFDSDGNGDISVSEMKKTIVSTYKERKFISKSLEDASHALSQLDLIFLMVAFIILIFESFAIFNVDIGKSLTTFYTLAIGASFVFKESAQNVFDSIIFLLVTHPFDTGDRIVVDDSVMSVRKMSLLSCEFILWDNTQIFISNALLSQMFITNLRRSGFQWECVTMQVAYDSSLEALDGVQADLIHWLQTEPERMFEPSTAIVPQTIDFMRSITVTIGMTHRDNWQDWGGRWVRRNAFFAAVCYYMKKHGIKYFNSNQPIIYWTDDAAQSPPKYETATGEDRQSTHGEDNGQVNDSYLPPSPTSAVDPQASSRTPQGRSKSFMNFTPPSDELDNSGLRIRKARQARKGLAMQGGDG